MVTIPANPLDAYPGWESIDGKVVYYIEFPETNERLTFATEKEQHQFLIKHNLCTDED